jgi:hypothetical protein
LRCDDPLTCSTGGHSGKAEHRRKDSDRSSIRWKRLRRPPLA